MNMKLKIGLLAAMLLACAGYSYSQTNTPADSRWFQLVSGASEAGQLSVAAYPGYAPGLVIDGVKKEWGAGVALLYPLGDYVLVGGRLDYMADEFWMPSATVGLKLDVKLFNKLVVTPFTIGGAIIPLGGAGEDNHEVGAIVGGGIYSTIWKPAANSSLQIFYSAEMWTIWPDIIIHRPGIAFSIRF